MSVLNGKVVIVTGGSRGMGRRFVEALVANGAKVACLARASADLDGLAAEFGASVAAIACDVASSTEVNAAIAEAAKRFGKIDALVNNAAIFHPFAIEDATDDHVRQHIDINLTAIVWLTRAAIPHLKKTRGQIISISSESVRLPFPTLALYAATKAGVETLSAGLRDELRADGVRVSVLRSGSVAGGTGSRSWAPGAGAAFMERIKKSGHLAFTGEAASPQSMAQALLALLTLPADVNVDLMEARAAAAKEGL